MAPQRESAWHVGLTKFVGSRGGALVRYAYFVSGDADGAADLVQDALVAAFSRWQFDDSPSNIEAYVRRSILNRHLSSLRRRSLWNRVAHLFHQDPELQTDALTDIRADLAVALDRLSPRERACIVLTYYEDLTTQNVANTLGISIGAVKRYISDGLAKMRLTILPTGEHPELPELANDESGRSL